MSEKKVKVYKFEMEGCQPCKMLSGVMASKGIVPDHVEIITVDIFSAEGERLVQDFCVRGAPTLAYSKNGGPVTFVGYAPNKKDALIEWFKEI